MSDNPETKPADATPPPKKSSPGPLAMILPAVLAGAAAFGGARFAPARAAGPPQVIERVVAEAPPPGPTEALEPFLLMTQDANKKSHAMKVTIAVEFDANAKAESLKTFTPRIRDAALTYLRGVTFEDSVDATKAEKLRADLLERFKAAGASSATKVLITDLVAQ